MGLVEIAQAILSRSAQRVELCAQNLSNVTTPGYKARSTFDSLIMGGANAAATEAATHAMGVDFAGGALQNTGNPYDLAISGSGFFVVRDADNAMFYTRDGQFSRNADGKLVTADGKMLQSLSGDLAVGPGEPKVLADGTVLSNGEPSGRIAVMNFAAGDDLKPAGGNMFSGDSANAKPAAAEVHQGMLEASNVSTAVEMISMMVALRSAGSGQRVVQLYDDLMGRAVTAFSQQ
jgi:flagellar basal-body rod protein FlgG